MGNECVAELTRKGLIAIFVLNSIVIVFCLYAVLLAVGVSGIGPEAFRSLVDANAALLGFLGVITVFVLNTYRDASRTTEDRIYKLKREYDESRRLATAPQVESPVETPSYSFLDEEYEIFNAKLQELEDSKDEQKLGSKESLDFTIVSGACYVVSILFCLMAMGNVSTQARFIITYGAIVATFMGVFTMFGMIWNLKVRLK